MHHRPPAPAGHRRTGALTVLLVVLLTGLLGAPQAVSASWSQAGTGPAAAQGTSVPAVPARPTSNRPFLSNTVTVAWTAVTVRGAAVSGYVVTRYDGNGAVSAMAGGSTCLGATRNTVPNVVTTLTCTDERPFGGSGTFTYRVRPVLERWYGPFSDPTTPAV